MKTVLTAAFVLGAILLLGWIAFAAYPRRSEDSSLTMHPSNFEKAPIEWVSENKVSVEEEGSVVKWGEEEGEME